MEEKAKPKLFIASSVESLETAHALQENLEYAAEVTVWTQGVFHLTKTTLNTLLSTIGSYDFAIFVFAPDDVINMRKKTLNVTRDNVIFELGMFMNQLGEERCFLVMPRDEELHLPTDIIGITPATYDSHRMDKNIVAALGPACTKIKREMNAIGIRNVPNESDELSAKVASGLSIELSVELSRMMQNQEELIQAAFARFEKRLSNAGVLNSVTNKAPKNRISFLLNEKISEISKAILFNMTPHHITLEEYEALNQSQEINAGFEELRANNLIVPLSGIDDDGYEIPVFWFHPKHYEMMIALLEQDFKVDLKINRLVKKAFKNAGYNYQT